MEQNKIGILTFHRADNLGAVLQAYALQTVLRENFHREAEIIDYRCPALEGGRKSGIALRCYYALKHRGFEKFRKRQLKLSPIFTPQTIRQCGGYAAYITGSDQVWNCECSQWDMAYFLNFAEAPKYAYAASIGQYRFSPEERPEMEGLLQSFAGISVREASAAEQLKELGIGKVTVAPDPVLLLKKERWMRLMSRRLYGKPYVFVYQILPSETLLQRARDYAQSHGCKVICNKTSPEFIFHGSPSDFLSWMYYAEAVFTNSFHGTAFSLIFEKAFSAETRLPDGKRNLRVAELLCAAGGSDCAASTPRKPDCAAALEKLQEQGLSFLDIVCEI